MDATRMDTCSFKELVYPNFINEQKTSISNDTDSFKVLSSLPLRFLPSSWYNGGQHRFICGAQSIKKNATLSQLFWIIEGSQLQKFSLELLSNKEIVPMKTVDSKVND